MCVHYGKCENEVCPVNNPDTDIYCEDWQQLPEAKPNACCASGQVVSYMGEDFCVRCKKAVER